MYRGRRSPRVHGQRRSVSSVPRCVSIDADGALGERVSPLLPVVSRLAVCRLGYCSKDVAPSCRGARCRHLVVSFPLCHHLTPAYHWSLLVQQIHALTPQCSTHTHPLVVVHASYETLRSEADYFGSLRFNYCVLDEGHVIKNPKSKITQVI